MKIERLAQLRSQAGRRTEPDLAARIARLRVGNKSAGIDPGRRSDEWLADRVGGSVVAEGLLLVEESLPLAHQHGSCPLDALTAAGLGLPAAGSLEREPLLFMDTETTGLAGGSGTLVFMLGLARVEGGRLRLRQYLLTKFAGERQLLESCNDWTADRPILVTFNGKTFDAPLLATRSRLGGIADPFRELRHLDLLHPVRSAFGSAWEDCRLATTERRLLGFERFGDLPGSEAPAVWFDWIRRGRTDRMVKLLRHNRWDLVSLAALLPVLTRLYREPVPWGADAAAVARSWLRCGDEETAFHVLQESVAALKDGGRLELARLWRRRGCWDRACPIWRELAQRGNPSAIEALAKYQEHVRGDYRAALDLTRQLPAGPESRKRLERLQKRLVSGGYGMVCGLNRSALFQDG